MLVLGIILLVLVAIAVAGLVANGTSQDVAFNTSVVDVTTQPVWVFLAGALAMLVTLIGLSFIRRGTRRRVERRREMKRLRKVEKEHVSGPIPVTGTDQSTGQTSTGQTSTTPASTTPADDQPDRQLVREPGRQSVAEESTAPAHSTTESGTTESGTTESGTTESGRSVPATTTATSAAPATATEDPARHREP